MTRSLITLAALAAIFATAPGCKRKRPAGAASDQLFSVVHMSDQRAAAQLVKGVYAIEQGAWRWTAKDFAFMLKVPADGARKGATLNFKFTIPDVVLTKVGPSVTLACSVGGTPLPPETYSKAGEQTYTRDVPGASLAKDPAVVEFKLDKAMAPSGGDVRELGVVAAMVELGPK